jgi:hypothetical protein
MALFFAPWLVISNKERLYASSGGGLMFRDKAAGVYDVFVNAVNRNTHQKASV